MLHSLAEWSDVDVLFWQWDSLYKVRNLISKIIRNIVSQCIHAQHDSPWLHKSCDLHSTIKTKITKLNLEVTPIVMSVFGFSFSRWVCFSRPMKQLVSSVRYGDSGSCCVCSGSCCGKKHLTKIEYVSFLPIRLKKSVNPLAVCPLIRLDTS